MKPRPYWIIAWIITSAAVGLALYVTEPLRAAPKKNKPDVLYPAENETILIRHENIGTTKFPTYWRLNNATNTFQRVRFE